MSIVKPPQHCCFAFIHYIGFLGCIFMFSFWITITIYIGCTLLQNITPQWSKLDIFPFYCLWQAEWDKIHLHSFNSLLSQSIFHSFSILSFTLLFIYSFIPLTLSIHFSLTHSVCFYHIFIPLQTYLCYYLSNSIQHFAFISFIPHFQFTFYTHSVYNLSDSL